MLIWIFGSVEDYKTNNSDKKTSGTLFLKNAKVEYNLSTDKNDLPWKEWKPFRSISVDGEELEFSNGFTDLHSISYQEILQGNGFGLNDVEETIKLIENIR